MATLAEVFADPNIEAFDADVFAHCQQRLGLIRAMAGELAQGRLLSMQLRTGMRVLAGEHSDAGLLALCDALDQQIPLAQLNLQPLYDLAAMYDSQLWVHAGRLGMHFPATPVPDELPTDVALEVPEEVQG